MATVQTALNKANITDLASLLNKAKIGDTLGGLVTRVTDDKAVDATFKCTLSPLPIRGSIIAARKTGGYLKQNEVHPSCTLGASDYLVDYDTGEVTFETTDFNDTDEASFVYLSAGTLAADLAASWPGK